MLDSRRKLLKVAGLAGLGIGALPQQAMAQATPKGVDTRSQTRRLTVATIVTKAGLGLGVRTPGGVLDVASVARERRVNLPATVDDLIHGRGDGAAFDRLVAAPPAKYIIAESTVKFGPCVTAPEKILCLGLNYRAHAAEGGQPPPKTPILFNKFNSALNAHGGTIRISDIPARQWDYEAEMVVVIGKTARNVAEAEALNYVFGYSTGQDFSARDLQMLTSQWMLGKTGDGWGPVGPWLVSSDQVDPDNLAIKCFVNGEQRQSSNTAMMIFSTRFMVSYISRYMTLKPGDIIFTGTPEGVILGYPPEKQVWLKPGDKIVTSIERLGDQAVTLI
jgi:2-keto-4-pentenoate hydratase/2-oxohepta-3-ene-1,7-dioic acid hydratase in catechol pathway